MKKESSRRRDYAQSSRPDAITPDYRNEPCFDSFVCKSCGHKVKPEGAGSAHRNHCPNCLSSLHVDNEPGDRGSNCGGVMEPISVWVKNNGEWAIIHRCKRCGKLDSNRVAADDNPLKLMSIALKPLAEPLFPIERMQELAERMGYGKDNESEDDE